jgi:hypothetical protein
LTLGVIHTEQLNRGPADRASTENQYSPYSKMISPSLSPRVEQPDNSCRSWIKRGKIRAFELVAAIASEGEVGNVVWAPVLAWDDMLYLMS